MEMICNYL